MPWLRNYSISRRLSPLGLLLSCLLLCQSLTAAPQAASQTRSRRPTPQTTLPLSPATQPKFKGIWEPVNYPDDIYLSSVFFVSDKVGWAGGGARGWNTGGVLIHTTDGGEHWGLQLGDPESSQAGFFNLYFLDATHGWVTQGDQFLRTSDGVNWEQAGSLPTGYSLRSYVFTSPMTGIAITGGYGGYQYSVFVTRDGGRTWNPTWACNTSLEVNGLTNKVSCPLNAVHFISPSVGYAVGGNTDLVQGRGFVVVAKTEDGGATWRVIFSSTNDFAADGVFFIDENTGYMRVGSTKLLATSDGGRTWHGIPTPVPATGRILFADPEVGWICGYTSMAFTGDSGRRWSPRDFHFPEAVYGWSFPRRDRAYVVGQHGMVYRYRVVPVTYQAAAHSIEAPAMPGFDSPVFGEVATLKDVVAKLRAKLPAPSGDLQQSSGTAGGGGAGAPGSGSFQQDTTSGAAPGSAAAGVGASGFQQDTGTGPVASGYMDSCCGPLIQQLETTANSFATNVPAFSQRFRNLNLILEGLNLVNSIVGQANTLKQSIRALRQARDPQAAAVALSTVQTQVNGISSSGGFVQDVSTPLQP